MPKITLLLCLIPMFSFAQEDSRLLLAKAVSYHDPANAWSDLRATLYFTETRPSGPDRKTEVMIDNEVGRFTINRNDEEAYAVVGDSAEVLLEDGSEDRGLTLRNYYLYLWGLPMKLYDESTPEVNIASGEKVDGLNTYVLKVSYEEDVWYFYFDKDSGRMLQYKFYKDEPAGKGELIKLEGELVVKGMNIPQKRSWYALPEMKYLGTDILDKSE